MRRLLSGAAVLVFVTLVVTGIVYLAPVDAERLSFGQRADSETVLSLQKHYGLDQSLRVQFARYMRDLSPVWLMRTGEAAWRDLYASTTILHVGHRELVIKKPYMRDSYQCGRPVAEILAEVIPLTIILALCAMVIALLLGISLGSISAIYAGSWVDQLIVSMSVLGYSLPSYVSSIVLALTLGYMWSDWTGLPLQGSLREMNDLGDVVWRWNRIILPAIALGIRPVAVICQLSRSSLLEVMSEPYVKTARAKGLSAKKVFIQHILRNGLNPVVTASTGWLASMLAGSFFVETVFNYKGLGYTTVNALINFDIPLILGAVLFTCAVFVIMNILVDILYTYLDPRLALS